QPCECAVVTGECRETEIAKVATRAQRPRTVRQFATGTQPVVTAVVDDSAVARQRLGCVDSGCGQPADRRRTTSERVNDEVRGDDISIGLDANHSPCLDAQT